MAYLIDGNNFLGWTLAGQIRDHQSKVNLIRKIRIFQSLKRCRVIVVFDGPPEEVMPEEECRNTKLAVVHPSPGSTADSAIKDIITRQTDRRRLFVVSSDRELLSFVKSKGAQSLSCKDFNQLLGKALKDHKKASELKKEAVLPSKLETDIWIRIFNQKK